VPLRVPKGDEDPVAAIGFWYWITAARLVGRAEADSGRSAVGESVPLRGLVGPRRSRPRRCGRSEGFPWYRAMSRLVREFAAMLWTQCGELCHRICESHTSQLPFHAVRAGCYRAFMRRS